MQNGKKNSSSANIPLHIDITLHEMNVVKDQSDSDSFMICTLHLPAKLGAPIKRKKKGNNNNQMNYGN